MPGPTTVTRLHPAADPSAAHWRTGRLRMVGADPTVVRDLSSVRALLRPFARLTEVLASPGRFAVGLELSVTDGSLDAVLVLSAGAETPDAATTELHALTTSVRSLLSEAPHVFAVDDDDRPPVPAPTHGLRIRQSTVEVADQLDTARAVARFERAVDPWTTLVRVMEAAPAPLVLRTCLLATQLTPADEEELEREAAAARRIHSRHQEELLGRRALRVLSTIQDVAESFHAPVLLADVLLASDAPIDEATARAVGTALTTERDVTEAPERHDLATSTVAARRRLVGGFELTSTTTDELDRVWHDNLPATGDLRPRTLADLVSVTEAAQLVRWPLPAGSPLPGVAARGGAPPVHGPALDRGLRVGADLRERPAHLDVVAPPRHLHVTGATGSGKSTLFAHLTQAALTAGHRVVLLDGHEQLARGLATWAAHHQHAVALLDGSGPRIRLLDHADEVPDATSEDQVVRIVDAIVSMWNDEWTGPRWRQLAGAALRVLSHVPGAHPTAHIRDLVDEDVLKLAARHSTADRRDLAAVRRLFTDDQDVIGWMTSKFDVLRAPLARAVLAPVGGGRSLGELLPSRDLVAIPLGGARVTADEGRMVSHVVLSLLTGALQALDDGRSTLVLIDEAQRFGGHHLRTLLTEGRKFGITVAAAHQFSDQLSPTARAALADNASVTAAFRTHVDAGDVAARLGVSSGALRGLADLHALVQAPGPRGAVSTTVRLSVPDLPRPAPAAAPASDVPSLASLLSGHHRAPQLDGLDLDG